MRGYDDDNDNDYEGYRDEDAESDDADLDGDDDPDNNEDTIPPIKHPTGEHGVEVSLEIDEKGNEVWFAQDSRIPGGTSQGHSVEEAIDGVEERRRQYREMLRRSRKPLDD